MLIFGILFGNVCYCGHDNERNVERKMKIRKRKTTNTS
jgi:hypothetical protein